MKLFGTRLKVADLRRKYGGAFFSLLWPDLIAFTLIGALAWHRPYITLTRPMPEFFTRQQFRDYCRGRLLP